MRIFNCAVEAVREVERDLGEMGHKVHTKTYQDKVIEGRDEYSQKELVGYSFTLTSGTDWPDCFLALGLKDPEQCKEYVLIEAQDRVFKPNYPLNPGKSWEKRKEVWKQFFENTGGFSYTYPERLHSFKGLHRIRYNQLEEILRLSEMDPESRQLVLPIFDFREDNTGRGGVYRVPCTMHYQILIRPPFFYLIHNMRSCDLYTHFALDMSISWLMLQFLKGIMGAKKEWTPRLIMQIGSLHAFKKDLAPRNIF